MARPIRLEFPNGLYHVMSGGNGGETIFAEDEDRQQFLDLLAELITRYEALCYTYCYHNCQLTFTSTVLQSP